MTRARRGVLLRFAVVILVLRLGIDAATPNLPGAFHLMGEAPSDVIHAPRPAAAAGAVWLAPPRAPARSPLGPVEVDESLTSLPRRPFVPRAIPHLRRAPDIIRSSDVPEDD